MRLVTGPRSVESGSELEPRAEQAMPVQFSPLGGGDWAEDEATQRRRRRKRWQRAGSASLALVAVAALIVIFSRVYEARSSILIRPPSADATVPQAIDGALQSEVEILKSSGVAERAVRELGVATLYTGLSGNKPEEALAEASDRVQRALVVRTLPGSDVIEVVFRHGDAQVAADTVNQLVEHYQAVRQSALVPGASERFLEDRIEEQRQTLADAESALAVFHAENPVMVASDPRSALAERMAAVEAEMRELRDSADDAKSAGSSDNPSVQRARKRLDDLELQLQETLNTHVETSRAVTGLRHEIGLVEDYLATKERSAAREQTRRLGVLEGRRGELEAQLAELERARRDLPELEKQGRQLTRARDVAARRLDAYQRELETATVAADVGEHKVALAVRVLEPARAPTRTIVPTDRGRIAVALTGVALLILAGVALMDWLEQRRARRQPNVWTAHVGAGGDSGSVALLMPNQQGGPRGGGPVVLLLSGNNRNGPDPDRND
jgi:uncharacterized protein involved in exopolysaccharide biosynthesis